MSVSMAFSDSWWSKRSRAQLITSSREKGENLVVSLPCVNRE
jgi:hypothetical protein